MAQALADVDPENYIIGLGSYSNLQTAIASADEHVFRLDPAPMPVRSLIILNLLFAAFFVGFHLLFKYVTHGEANPWFVYGAPFGVGLLTCGAFTGVVYWEFSNAQRLGPWLIYNKSNGSVELPREQLAFNRDEIVHLQYITTKRLNWGGTANNERLSELNLMTCRNGERRRWPLLRSNNSARAFDRLLEPLLRETDLRVVRVQDEWLGWRVTETPYGPAKPASGQANTEIRPLLATRPDPLSRDLGEPIRTRGSALGTALSVLGRIETVIFACLWAGFGIVAFIQISAWGRAYDQKQAAIAKGAVQEETLYVAVVNHSQRNTGGWDLGIRKKSVDASKIVEYRHVNARDKLAVGTPIAAFKFPDGYLIPRFDQGGFNWGRWAFLAFGLVPPMIVGTTAGLLAWRRKHDARQ
jgi:hypothetical protein